MISLILAGLVMVAAAIVALFVAWIGGMPGAPTGLGAKAWPILAGGLGIAMLLVFCHFLHLRW